VLGEDVRETRGDVDWWQRVGTVSKGGGKELGGKAWRGGRGGRRGMWERGGGGGECGGGGGRCRDRDWVEELGGEGLEIRG